MRSLLIPLLALLLTCSYAAVGLGEITREHHPWGSFEPGAWKLVQVVTESFDEGEKLATVTVTKTTLNEVTAASVNLLVEVSVDLAGRQFDAEPQAVRQSFNGELASEEMKVTELAAGEVTIGEREIPCKIQQLEMTNCTCCGPVALVVGRSPDRHTRGTADTTGP